MMSWPGCSPLSSRSRSPKPVGTPAIMPSREPTASISSRAGWSRSARIAKSSPDAALGHVVDGLLGQVDDVVDVATLAGGRAVPHAATIRVPASTSRRSTARSATMRA